ncbi:MAG: hypothetical protein BRC58_00805, partial [Cyanobacteria bacterium QS_8_64_29]
ERQSDQYLLLGMAGGLVATVAAYVAVGGTWRRYYQMQGQRARSQPASAAAWPVLKQFRVAFRNRPFLLVMGIYWCSWMELQVTAAMLPYTNLSSGCTLTKGHNSHIEGFLEIVI